MPMVTFETEEAIPEALRAEAKPVEGGTGYQVDVVPTTKLTEFRNNNIALKRQVESAGTVLSAIREIHGIQEGDLDIEKIRNEVNELRGLKTRVENKQLVDDVGMEAVIQQRTAEMRTQYEGKLKVLEESSKKLEGDLTANKNKFATVLLENAVSAAVMHPDSKANVAALPDILARARSVFKVDPDAGTIVPMKGDTVLYGPDASTPMTPSQWIDSILTEAPYLAKGSSGGGVRNGGTTAFEQAGTLPIETFYEKRKAELAASRRGT